MTFIMIKDSKSDSNAAIGNSISVYGAEKSTNKHQNQSTKTEPPTHYIVGRPEFQSLTAYGPFFFLRFDQQFVLDNFIPGTLFL